MYKYIDVCICQMGTLYVFCIEIPFLKKTWPVKNKIPLSEGQTLKLFVSV